MLKERSSSHPALMAGLHGWLSHKKGKETLLPTCMDRAQSAKDFHICQEEFDFSEEDCALNRNMNEKKKFTVQWPIGSVNKNGLNFWRLRHMGSQRSWSNGPFGFRNLMNCFSPNFVLLYKALPSFPSEITLHGEHIASLFSHESNFASWVPTRFG